jgi:hypothetical protein
VLSGEIIAKAGPLCNDYTSHLAQYNLYLTIHGSEEDKLVGAALIAVGYGLLRYKDYRRKKQLPPDNI